MLVRVGGARGVPHEADSYLYCCGFLLQPFNGELVALLLQQRCQCVPHCRVVAIQMGFLRKMGTKISGIL